MTSGHWPVAEVDTASQMIATAASELDRQAYRQIDYDGRVRRQERHVARNRTKHKVHHEMPTSPTTENLSICPRKQQQQ